MSVSVITENNGISIITANNNFRENLNCQIKLDFSSNSEKLGRVIDNSMMKLFVQ